MTKLEDLKPGVKVTGIIPGQTVSVVNINVHGQTAVELFYKRADDQTGSQPSYRSGETNLEIVETRRTWRFDAAGEGINLQRAHLMINYDLPWNPNRLEQRFGRIHRIGQTEVCHLWNLVAGQTREGQVYRRLLSKLETESKALEGKVFDVLGLLLGLLLGDQTPPDLRQRRITEAIAMQAVMQAETALGHHLHDVSKENLGYDIESLDPRTGHLRFIEVKGRRAGADTVTVTHNEIMYGINSPEQFILAIVEVETGQGREPRYGREPFPREPHSTEASINYRLADLLARLENKLPAATVGSLQEKIKAENLF